MLMRAVKQVNRWAHTGDTLSESDPRCSRPRLGLQLHCRLPPDFVLSCDSSQTLMAAIMTTSSCEPVWRHCAHSGHGQALAIKRIILVKCSINHLLTKRHTRFTRAHSSAVRVCVCVCWSLNNRRMICYRQPTTTTTATTMSAINTNTTIKTAVMYVFIFISKRWAFKAQWCKAWWKSKAHSWTENWF